MPRKDEQDSNQPLSDYQSAARENFIQELMNEDGCTRERAEYLVDKAMVSRA